jgi:hypothetical protein
MKIAIHNLIAIADAANLKLKLRGNDVEGQLDLDFEVDQFKMPFDLVADYAVMSPDEQAYAVLFKGPGDFRLAIAYSSKSDALVAYVLDASLVGYEEDRCQVSKASSVMQAIRSWKRDAIRTYTKKRLEPKWREVDREHSRSGTTATGIS